MTKIPHFDDTNTGRFVTFNCYRNIQAFRNDLAKRLFIEELSALRTRLLVLIYGYVIMLEHVHLVLHPTLNTPMSRIVRELKSLSARRYFAESGVRPTGETGVFWQPGYYDYNCRTHEDILQKIEYCHNNPVRRGLVSVPGEWIWSSYNWYHGERSVPIAMDPIDAEVA